MLFECKFVVEVEAFKNVAHERNDEAKKESRDHNESIWGLTNNEANPDVLKANPQTNFQRIEETLAYWLPPKIKVKNVGEYCRKGNQHVENAHHLKKANHPFFV